jgi:hypothetical protein
MKKILLASTTLFLVVGALAMRPPAAEVVRWDGCNFVDANNVKWFGITDCTIQRVATNNTRGIGNEWVKGTLPEGAAIPTTAMHVTGLTADMTCYGNFDWKGVIRPTGTFSVKCQQRDEP